VAKLMSFDDDARKQLLAGVSKLSRAVASTLGPRGRNAVLDKGWGSPKVTKDGVTVAEDIELEDKFENCGVQLVKEAASKTGDVAGDGTTTATVLAEAVYREGLKFIAAGAAPVALQRGVQKAIVAVTDHLAKIAQPVDATDKKAIETVATIAGNNDKGIGKILADALMKVGKDGVITVEEGRGMQTDVELVEGMQFERGYLSPHFVTNEDDQEAVLENCCILIHEEKISNAILLSERRVAQSQASIAEEQARSEVALVQESAQTDKDKAVAKREREIALLRSERENAVAATTARQEAETRLVTAQASAKSESLRMETEAKGRAALIAAENGLSDAVIAMKLQERKLDRLPEIMTQMMKPVEKIDSIRINQISGMGGNSDGSGKAGGIDGAFGAAMEQILGMAVRLPAMKQMGEEIGLDFDANLAGRTADYANRIKTKTEPDKPTGEKK